MITLESLLLEIRGYEAQGSVYCRLFIVCHVSFTGLELAINGLKLGKTTGKTFTA